MNRLEPTAEHVQELATRYGENVLVPQPGAYGLWVIGTGNQHYDGWTTVYATSEQVIDLALPADYDEDGCLTDGAAERIARHLRETPRETAQGYARGMAYPEGYTARVMRELQE
jgi:hypothetical protein